MTPLEATRDAFTRTGARRIAVAVSGGKDSLAVLDVSVRHFGAENVTGFLMYLVKDLDVEWRSVRALERRFKIKVIGVPHWELSRYLKYHAFRPYTPACNGIKLLKQADVEQHVRKLTGVEWFAWGMRAADSVVRNAYLKRIQGVDDKQRRVYPLWTWKKRDVVGWLHRRKIAIPSVTGGKRDMGGVNLRPDTLRWLRDHEPADYAKILEVFPFVEAQIIRESIRAEAHQKDVGGKAGV